MMQMSKETYQQKREVIRRRVMKDLKKSLSSKDKTTLIKESQQGRLV